MTCPVRDFGQAIERLQTEWDAASTPAGRFPATTTTHSARRGQEHEWSAGPQSHPHSRGPRRGPVQHEWSKGPWKHKPQPIEPNNPFLALTFWALLIFCCVVAAVSIGYQLSQPL